MAELPPTGGPTLFSDRLAAAARAYYYLAPVWLALELSLFPGWRSGLVAPPGLGTLLFYAVEAGIGAAFWRRSRWAGRAALAENVFYFIAIVKFVSVTPMDVAALGDVDPVAAEALGRSFTGRLPGMLCTGFQLAIQISRELSSPRAAFARIQDAP